MSKATPVWAFLSMPLPSASIVFGWPICDDGQKKCKITTDLAINNLFHAPAGVYWDARDLESSKRCARVPQGKDKCNSWFLNVFLTFQSVSLPDERTPEVWNNYLFAWFLRRNFLPYSLMGRKTPPASNCLHHVFCVLHAYLSNSFILYISLASFAFLFLLLVGR